MMLRRVEQGDRGGDESRIRHVGGDQRVHLLHDALQRIIVQSDRTKISATGGDQQCRADAVAGGVGDGEQDFPVGQFEPVIIIAAGLLRPGWLQPAMS